MSFHSDILYSSYKVYVPSETAGRDTSCSAYVSPLGNSWAQETSHPHLHGPSNRLRRPHGYTTAPLHHLCPLLICLMICKSRRATPAGSGARGCFNCCLQACSGSRSCRESPRSLTRKVPPKAAPSAPCPCTESLAARLRNITSSRTEGEGLSGGDSSP